MKIRNCLIIICDDSLVDMSARPDEFTFNVIWTAEKLSPRTLDIIKTETGWPNTKAMLADAERQLAEAGALMPQPQSKDGRP